MSLINKKIKEKVLSFLKKYCLSEKNPVLLVGFSGGVDSACLLDVLIKLSKEYEFKPIAGHLNHNWRREESEKEAVYAENFCWERNIEFVFKKLPENLPKTEEEARKQRYDFFNETSEEKEITAILTGHTLSDQTETILYRIIKGTGIKGLKGIPEMRKQDGHPDIYRPILEISREETIQYCKENNIEPNIDSSNEDIKYLRNKIRSELLPELKTYNSGAETALLRLSAVAGDSEDIIEEYLEILKLKIYSEPEIISAKKFKKLSTALQKRILYDLFVKNNIDYDYEKIATGLEFIKDCTGLKSGNTLSVAENLWLFASSSEIRIISEIKAEPSSIILPLNLERETYFHSLGISVKTSNFKGKNPEKFPKETDFRIYADLSRIKSPLFLRTRRPGDKIQPFGMKEKTKLKKYLINKGVPEFKRDKLLLLTNEEEILWVVGVGMSELLRVNNIPTHVIEAVIS